MADDGPIVPHISPYLRRSLRSLKKAKQDGATSRPCLISVVLSEPVSAVPRSSIAPNSGTGITARTSIAAEKRPSES
jgi:hypothetical protein